MRFVNEFLKIFSQIVIFVDYSQIVIYNVGEVNKMRIRELRIQRNLQQKDLAAALEIAANTLSQYENGKREPDQETLIKLADYFGVTTDYLLGRTDEPTTQKTESDAIEALKKGKYNVIIGMGGDPIYAKVSEEDAETLRRILKTMQKDNSDD